MAGCREEYHADESPPFCQNGGLYADPLPVETLYEFLVVNSQRTGSIEFSVDLANCFGVSLDYLLLGTEVENKKQILQSVISFLSELEAEL